MNERKRKSRCRLLLLRATLLATIASLKAGVPASYKLVATIATTLTDCCVWNLIMHCDGWLRVLSID